MINVTKLGISFGSLKECNCTKELYNLHYIVERLHELKLFPCPILERNRCLEGMLNPIICLIGLWTIVGDPCAYKRPKCTKYDFRLKNHLTRRRILNTILISSYFPLWCLILNFPIDIPCGSAYSILNTIFILFLLLVPLCSSEVFYKHGSRVF